MRPGPSRLVGALVALLLGACGADGGPASATIRLATTTSARDTGLLDVLLPAFRAESGIEVQAIAVGTGEALKYGERGDADVVLVHARKAEDAFMAAGHGLEREDVWWNRFLVVGPPPDAPEVRSRMTVGAAQAALPEKGPGSAAAFLRAVRTAGLLFASRGDASGTHVKEKALWGEGFTPWPGYLDTGQGMGPTLTIADEKGAFTLTDEGTYLRMRRGLRLVPWIANDAALENPYGAILVKPPAGEDAHLAPARRLYAWLVSERCRTLVREFRVEGARAFYLHGETAPAGTGTVLGAQGQGGAGGSGDAPAPR